MSQRLSPDVDVPLLEVRDLRVGFQTESGFVQAVDGLSLTVAAGEVVGLVGESGSGKSVSMMSIMRLIRDPNVVVAGEARYRGRDLLSASNAEMRRVRGAEIAMIFQDPMTSLNPVQRVGRQIEEQLREHDGALGTRRARARAGELLASVGIPNASRRADDYPHQFSGGMRQRVMIAMAISCQPRLLIADEPTTALDVTIQAQILGLLRKLKDETGSSIVLVTHDLGVVADLTDRVCVMYGGRLVEESPRRPLFYDPQHPYTWGLLGSIPRLDRPRTDRLQAIAGSPATPRTVPDGCPFMPRCAYAHEACGERPTLTVRGGGAGHPDACVLAPDVRAQQRAALDLGLPEHWSAYDGATR